MQSNITKDIVRLDIILLKAEGLDIDNHESNIPKDIVRLDIILLKVLEIDNLL